MISDVDIKQIRDKAKESLYFFAKGVLAYDWLTPHIHLPVCKVLEDPELTRALIELPRGWLKTTVASIAYPMWLSVRNPNIRVLLVQNSATNACKKLSVIGQQWENNAILRAIFPELLPNKNSVWTADAKCLTRSASFAESTYEAAGTATKVVSRHYDVIIEDDTVAPDVDELGNESLAPTHSDVQKAIGWHRTNSLPLLNNPTKDKIIIVGTRWYDQDLIRWVKDNEPQYKVISRAVRENEDGKPDVRGQVTYPERFSAEVLKELEVGLGPYMYSCLYMNTPVRSEDMLFKPSWMKYYEQPPPPQHLAVYTTVDVATDPALAKSSNIDYNVVMTCAKDVNTGYIYVLDYFRARCSPGELSSAIFDHVIKYRPACVGYDDTAYQRSIDYWLKELMRQENVYFILEPLSRSGRDAKTRAISALQPIFASGNILLRTHMKELESELLKFPLGDHDDLPDALAMQLQLWRKTKLNHEIRREKAANVLEFDLDSIRARKGLRLGSLVFDPSRSSSNDMETYGLPRISA